MVELVDQRFQFSPRKVFVLVHQSGVVQQPRDLRSPVQISERNPLRLSTFGPLVPCVLCSVRALARHSLRLGDHGDFRLPRRFFAIRHYFRRICALQHCFRRRFVSPNVRLATTDRLDNAHTRADACSCVTEKLSGLDSTGLLCGRQAELALVRILRHAHIRCAFAQGALDLVDRLALCCGDGPHDPVNERLGAAAGDTERGADLLVLKHAVGVHHVVQPVFLRGLEHVRVDRLLLFGERRQDFRRSRNGRSRRRSSCCTGCCGLRGYDGRHARLCLGVGLRQLDRVGRLDVLVFGNLARVQAMIEVSQQRGFGSGLRRLGARRGFLGLRGFRRGRLRGGFLFGRRQIDARRPQHIAGPLHGSAEVAVHVERLPLGLRFARPRNDGHRSPDVFLGRSDARQRQLPEIAGSGGFFGSVLLLGGDAAPTEHIARLADFAKGAARPFCRGKQRPLVRVEHVDRRSLCTVAQFGVDLADERNRLGRLRRRRRVVFLHVLVEHVATVAQLGNLGGCLCWIGRVEVSGRLQGLRCAAGGIGFALRRLRRQFERDAGVCQGCCRPLAAARSCAIGVHPATHDTAGNSPLDARSSDVLTDGLALGDVLPRLFLHGLRKLFEQPLLHHGCRDRLVPRHRGFLSGGNLRLAAGHVCIDVFDAEALRQLAADNPQSSRSDTCSRRSCRSNRRVGAPVGLVHLRTCRDGALAERAGQ